MRRVLWTGAAVVVGDGVLLGASMALGWTILVVLAALVGLAGTLFVVRAMPAPRTTARPSTVTLGVPLRARAEESGPVTAEPATAPELPATITAPAPVAA